MHLINADDELPTLPSFNSIIKDEKRGIIQVTYAILECCKCNNQRKIRDVKGLSVFQTIEYPCLKCENRTAKVISIYSENRIKRKNLH